MRRRLLSPSLLAVPTLVLGACADPSSTVAPGGVIRDGMTVGGGGGQYLVGVAPGGELDAAALAASGGRVVGTVSELGVHVVADVVDPAPLVGAAGVAFVERDYSVTLEAQPVALGGPDAPRPRGRARRRGSSAACSGTSRR
jgi:hypothetical protein